MLFEMIATVLALQGWQLFWYWTGLKLEIFRGLVFFEEFLA